MKVSIFRLKEFERILKEYYIDFNGAPADLPGCIVVYADFYQVFHSEEIKSKARSADQGVRLCFSPDLFDIYPDRQFTNKIYIPDKSGKFLSEEHKEEIISHYLAIGYAVDDLYPVRRCPWCGALISGRADKMFCDKGCAAAFHTLTNSHEWWVYDNLLAMGTSEEIEEASARLDELKDRINKKYSFRKCLNCGAPITRSNAKFCCKKCRFDFHNKKKKEL